MTSCTAFEETLKIHHWGRPGLKGFIYTDVFEPYFFHNLKKIISSILDTDKKTYLTHTTTFSIGNQDRRILSHAQNAREQNVVFDLTFLKDWYHQTSDTIKFWSDTKIKDTVSPIFYKCIKTVENLEPFNENKDDWIFYRMHLNYLSYQHSLQVHIDSAPHLTNVKNDPYTIDHRDARMFSITFYLYDHVPNMGGELFTPYGFIYRPKANTALAINGHQALHGVAQNMDQTPRHAFTMRIAHKDDLFLPGHPSKFLYDVSKNL